MAVKETIARPARTLMQGGPALVIVELIDAFTYDMADRQYGVLVAALTLLFSWVQAAVEDYKGKAVLRDITTENVPGTSS